MDNFAKKLLASESLAKMTEADFRQLSRFVQETWGIKLPINKKLMLEGRLRRRLTQLQMADYREYCEYLFSPEGHDREAREMIDLVSTNKTDFFREAEHFTYLVDQALPELRSSCAAGDYGVPLKIWSAGCSSGEEPYTMAMVLSDYAEYQPGFRFSIYASDISQKVLQTAVMAIYNEAKIAPVPLEMRRKYLMRSKDSSKQQVRFIPQIRNLITFDRINLMNIDEQVDEVFHIIFCRNVIIYFDRATQEVLLNKFAHKLCPGGYLFLGHSEALAGMQVPFRSVAPMVYRKI